MPSAFWGNGPIFDVCPACNMERRTLYVAVFVTVTGPLILFLLGLAEDIFAGFRVGCCSFFDKETTASLPLSSDGLPTWRNCNCQPVALASTGPEVLRTLHRKTVRTAKPESLEKMAEP